MNRPPNVRPGAAARPAAPPPPPSARIRALASGAPVDPGAERGFLAALAETIEAEAAAVVAFDEGAPVIRSIALDSRRDTLRRAISAEVRLAASEALRRPDGPAQPSLALPGAVAVAALCGENAALAVLVRADGAKLERARAVLELAARALGGGAGGEAPLKTALNQYLAALDGGAPEDAAGFAARLREAFGARQAGLGTGDGKLIALAPAATLQPRSPAEAALRDLLIRAGGADAPIVEHAAPARAPAETPPGAAAAEAGSGLAEAMSADTVVAARHAAGVIVLIDPRVEFSALDRPAWSTLAALASGLHEPTRRGRASATAWRKRLPALIAAALVIGAMFVPIPDRIRADARLEPEGRRFVAASFSAVLRRTLVEPGDEVATGEALAELEGEALRLSRVAAGARFEEATRKRDAALGEKRLAAAELARAEAEAAGAERDLMDWRIARLDLVSPVDGVIIDMPLRDADGAPVREGDVIAEVAPLDRLRVRIDLPIGDLPRLPEAPMAELTFDGGNSGALEVRDLSPASRVEAAEGASVLPLTATIDNPGHDLRPGQRGVALIPTGVAPLGIVLFRDAWRALERWTLR